MGDEYYTFYLQLDLIEMSAVVSPASCEQQRSSWRRVVFRYPNSSQLADVYIQIG